MPPSPQDDAAPPSTYQWEDARGATWRFTEGQPISIQDNPRNPYRHTAMATPPEEVFPFTVDYVRTCHDHDDCRRIMAEIHLSGDDLVEHSG